MLNILIADTDNSQNIISEIGLLNNNKSDNILVVHDFSKLPFKNLSDIDFIIADANTLIEHDMIVLSRLVKKELTDRLIVVGELEDLENLTYLIYNGIKCYEPDYEKASERIAILFEKRENEKLRSAALVEMINDGSLIKKIKQALEKGDSRVLQKNMAFANKLLPLSLSLLKDYFNVILKTVFEFAEEKGVRQIEKKEILSELMSKNDFEAARDYAIKKVTGIIHLVEVNKKNQNKLVAAYIKDYVDENFMKPDTNAGNIAERFGVSASYIGTLFKEQEKTTITKYITQLRITKAAELLSGTKLQIQSISKKVGYSDQNYFARIFKKQTGLSPGEYRSNSSH